MSELKKISPLLDHMEIEGEIARAQRLYLLLPPS